MCTIPLDLTAKLDSKELFVGEIFGGKDHTTVLYAFNKISVEMKARRELYNQVTEVINKIKSGR